MQSPTARLPVALGWARTLALGSSSPFAFLSGVGVPMQARGAGVLGSRTSCAASSPSAGTSFERSGLAGDFFENNFIPGVSCKSKMASETIKGPVCVGAVNAVAPVSLR